MGGANDLIHISGTSGQIKLAQSLLNQKVAEAQEYASKVEQSASARSPRHGPKFLLPGPANSETNSVSARESLVSTSSDGLLEVFASAIESPDRLWLQVKGPSTVELDRLNDTMTEYYKKPENRVIHALTAVRFISIKFLADNFYFSFLLGNSLPLLLLTMKNFTVPKSVAFKPATTSQFWTYTT